MRHQFTRQNLRAAKRASLRVYPVFCEFEAPPALILRRRVLLCNYARLVSLAAFCERVRGVRSFVRGVLHGGINFTVLVAQFFRQGEFLDDNARLLFICALNASAACLRVRFCIQASPFSAFPLFFRSCVLLCLLRRESDMDLIVCVFC